MKKPVIVLFVLSTIITFYSCGSKTTNEHEYLLDSESLEEEVVEDLPKFPFIDFEGVGEIKIGSYVSDIPSNSSFYDDIIINKIYSAMFSSHCVYLSENEFEKYKDDPYVDGKQLLEGIVKNGNDTMIIFRSSDSYTIDEINIYSPNLKFENGIGAGIGVNDLCSNYDGRILSTDMWEGEHNIWFDIHSFPENVVLHLSEKEIDADFFDWEGEYVMPKGGELISKVGGNPIYSIAKNLVENSYIEYIVISKKSEVNESSSESTAVNDEVQQQKTNETESIVVNDEVQQQTMNKTESTVVFNSKKDVFKYCEYKHFTNKNGITIQIRENGITFIGMIMGYNRCDNISTNFGPLYYEIKVDIYSKSVAILKFRDFNNEGWEAVLNSQDGIIVFGWAGMYDFPFRDYVPNSDMFYLEY